VVDPEVNDLDCVVVGEQTTEIPRCATNTPDAEDTDMRHAGDVEGGVSVVLRKEVEEWRDQMERIGVEATRWYPVPRAAIRRAGRRMKRRLVPVAAE
jgi:hypothetical protein